ncbi:MAG: TonB-dependent receptor [Oxalicibacterium faecigallinarum]|uniref:TonB-dependent receptor family protein n=1 Tax=Oxalicibacterium faecigallinarum TaxID=573741 RepID=UPI00280798C3|nr:TonB-dependent receptor [Oxalicibacterium faecigallinarum]MDQ7968351.1 TonB-dependent receptor [Oxalicibacterium faecigallinarum]
MTLHFVRNLTWAGTGLLVTGLAPAADSVEPQVLPSIAVTSDTSMRERAMEEIRKNPGGVGIRFGKDYREKAVIGIGEALSEMPGVYVQRPSGQESSRISIRGSGIAGGNVRGIRFLRDGLPLGRADDMNEGIYADVMTADRIEVYRGASSLQYGAATIGGVINLISPTAYTSPGAFARFEVGSDGFRRAQLKGGKVFEDGLDAFASITHYESDGFRANSAERSSRLYANLGYAFSATSRGRFHLTEEKYSGNLPGTLSLNEVLTTPYAANADNQRVNASIRTSPRWHLAYKHELDIGDADKLSFGLFHTGTKFDSPAPSVRGLYDATDSGVSMRHEINRVIDGHANRLVWGANYGRGDGSNTLLLSEISIPLLPPFPFFIPAQTGTVRDKRSNLEIFAENTYQATERLSLVVGAQAMHAKRATDNQTPFFVTEYPDGSAARTYAYVNPKVGAIWSLGQRNAQLYANLSRNHEAPGSLIFFTPNGTLDAQRATTMEIGTRGGDATFAWDVALYRSRIDNELLAVRGPNPGLPTFVWSSLSPILPSVSVNADSPTWHTGLELGLNGKQSLPTLHGSLDWNFVYTWSRFRFERDPVYGDNKLPGIPDHVLQAGWTYRHANGFYIGPQVVLGSGWYADQANTLKAPGYGVVNLSAGYVARSGYRLFIDARNLGDKYYASTANYLVDARTQQSNVFRPGQTRAVFVGVETRW